MVSIPGTDERVPTHTRPTANARIRERTLGNLARFVGAAPTAIDERISQLRAEWDIERTLEANAATAALLGAVLGAVADRRFLVLPAVVGGFLLQHAIQGWCPPLPIFRAINVRTSAEIHAEILALRLMRGDFGNRPMTAEAAMNAAETARPMDS
jgi:hypothetical protein